MYVTEQDDRKPPSTTEETAGGGVGIQASGRQGDKRLNYVTIYLKSIRITKKKRRNKPKKTELSLMQRGQPTLSVNKNRWPSDRARDSAVF